MMQDIIEFLQKFWGYQIYWFLSILLFLLAITSWWFVFRRRRQRFNHELSRAFTDSNPDLEARLTNIELRLEKILSQTTEMRDRIAWIEGQINVLQSKCEVGGADVSSFEEQVYKAYDSGKKITELAQEFDRDKGEIELILNLRRLKN